MTENLPQPGDGIYELLVAGAYNRRGWESVAFVPEAPGVAKRHDPPLTDLRMKVSDRRLTEY